MNKLNKKFEDKFPDLAKKVKKANSVRDLLASYEHIENEIMSDWYITLVNDMYTFIFAGLAGKKKREFINNVQELESMKPVLELEKVFEVFEQSGINSKAYNKAKEKYIKKYGDRVLGELKLETKTFRTNPELFDAYVQNFSKQELSSTAHQKRNGLFIKQCKAGIRNREISRMNRSRLFGLTREIFIKIGKILEEQNKLDNYRDVFYLFIYEIDNPSLDYKDIVKQRKKEFSFYEELPVYNRVLFDGNVKNTHHHFTELETSYTEECLVGTPVSKGVVAGEIIVIDDPSIEIDTTNKIIVAKSTDPGWVFLIKNSKGIIAERGSLLSHTAIISRELNIPAVVGVENATTTFKTGDMVKIDADKGIIERCFSKR